MTTKATLMIALLVTLLTSVSCSKFSSAPSSVAKNLMDYIEAGRIDDAVNLLSSSYIKNKGGIDSVKKRLTDTAWYIKEKKTLKSFDIKNEEVFGDLASVTASAASGDGIARTVLFKFIKENGAWKIDSVEPDFL